MMTPKIKCNQFNIKVTGENEVNIDLHFESQNWNVTTYKKTDPHTYELEPTEVKQYSNLEEAVTYAREIAGSKIV